MAEKENNQGVSEEVAVPAEEEHYQTLYERTVEYHRLLLESSPQDALRIFGLTLLYSLSPEEMLGVTESVGLESKGAEEHYNLGVRAARQQDFVRAAECFEGALALNPSLWDALYNLAVSYEEQGKTARAVTCWQAYVDSGVVHGEERKRIRKHCQELEQKS
jgi:tetratricopeptide (TPR) repeat protein